MDRLFLIIKYVEFFVHSGYNSFNRHVICKCFLPICYCFNNIIQRAEVLNLNKVQFIIFMVSPFSIVSKKAILLHFLLEVFVVVGVIFRSIIYFWVNFCKYCRIWIKVLFLHININFFHHLLKLLYISSK